MSFVVEEIPVVFLSIGPSHFAFATHLVAIPCPFEGFTVFPNILAKTVDVVVVELSIIYTPICQIHLSTAFFLSGHVLPFEPAPISPSLHTQSVAGKKKGRGKMY